MSIDGITIHAIAHELNERLSGAHIKKIAQPEANELIITASKDRITSRLLISASPSLPVVYLTPENKESPMTAPNFCMLLRKYIGSGRITAVSQVGMERVIRMAIDHLNEMGDPATKKLYIEIMGKYSNIILVDESDMVLDAIRHVSAAVSSVREVLPGREYFIPEQENHYSILTVTKDELYDDVFKRPLTIRKMFFESLTGFGPVMAEEICHRLDIDSDASVLSMSAWQQDALYDELLRIRDALLSESYTPVIICDKTDKPMEVYPFALSVYGDGYGIKKYDSISTALFDFYRTKNLRSNMDQKSHDLKKQVQTLLERNNKKLALQKKQYRDTESMDKYRLYGELLTANAYMLEPGMKKVTVNNYYDGTDVAIPLDETLPIMDNANKYYAKYNKLKRTRDALETQIKETEGAIEHLSSIMAAVSMAENEADLTPLKQELFDFGFTKKRPGGNGKGGREKKQRPLHFVTEDGYDVYVGKNNYQNEEVTFKIASGGDWWFHTKTIPGSHVIVKSKGKPDLPDHLYEIAASLAAWYSTGRDSEKVEIDYVQKKELKKVAGAAPGYVIYHTNYSMVAHPAVSKSLIPVK